MKKNLILLLAMLPMGCGLKQIDAPAPNEHERWNKPGSTVESIKKDLRACGSRKVTSFNDLRKLDECMLGKEYKFVDPVRGRKKCDSQKMIELPSCQSLNK